MIKNLLLDMKKETYMILLLIIIMFFFLTGFSYDWNTIIAAFAILLFIAGTVIGLGKKYGLDKEETSDKK